MSAEPGMLEKTYLAVGRDSRRWADSFCAAALPLGSRDYETFVRLVREESTFLEDYYEGRVRSPSPKQSLERYVSNETRRQVFKCLEHGGDSASPDAQFDLYVIAQSFRQRPPTNPIRWLKNAADGSHAMAGYLMAERILNYSTDQRVSAVIPPAEAGRAQLFHTYLRSAAESGVPQAQFLLGALYLGGTRWGTEFVQIPQGVEWLKRAATQSTHLISRNSAAQMLGNAYFEGKLVAQDYEEAFRWYTVIPKEQSVGIHAPYGGVGHRIRKMYCEGLGIDKDPAMGQAYSTANVPCP